MPFSAVPFDSVSSRHRRRRFLWKGMFTALVTPLLLFFGPGRNRSADRPGPLVAALQRDSSHVRMPVAHLPAEKETRSRWESGPLPHDALALLQRMDALGPPVIDKDWTLNRAACQKMDLDENEQVRLQLQLSETFTRLREGERAYIEDRSSTGESRAFTIFAHDEAGLRMELQDGIYRIIGAAHPAAADVLWNFAKARGDTDFAEFGKNEVSYFIKSYSGERERRYSLQRFEYAPSAGPGQPRQFVTQSVSDFDAAPPRYQLLLKGLLVQDPPAPER
jgi:hypothetical protein